jgi:hypothetical protein
VGRIESPHSLQFQLFCLRQQQFIFPAARLMLRLKSWQLEKNEANAILLMKSRKKMYEFNRKSAQRILNSCVSLVDRNFKIS